MAAVIRSPDLHRLLAELPGIERALAQPVGLLKAFGVAGLAEVGKNFRAGGRPAWKPLRPSTIAARRQGRGTGSAIPLRNTGRLQNSWDSRVEGTRAVEVFSDHFAAAFHEFGTRGPYIIKPKRPGGVLAFPIAATTFAGTAIGTVGGERRIVARKGRRAGKAVVPAKAVGFARSVLHPGLPRRRMIPTPEQLGPTLVLAARAFIRALFPRAST